MANNLNINTTSTTSTTSYGYDNSPNITTTTTTTTSSTTNNTNNTTIFGINKININGNFTKNLYSHSFDDDQEHQCELGCEIGRGNFSRVYQCSLHDDRVIKIQNIHNSLANKDEIEFSNRFERALQRYTIKTYGVRFNSDCVGFEMENIFLQGYTTLQNVENKFVNPNNDYIQQITIGLLWVLYNFNQELNTIHSDLNGGNIFINFNELDQLGKDYRSMYPMETSFFTDSYVDLIKHSERRSAIVLGDFGCCISLVVGTTQFSDIKNGCALYLSPESVKRGNELIQFNEEVYAVGILLMEMFLKSGSNNSKIKTYNILEFFKEYQIRFLSNVITTTTPTSTTCNENPIIFTIGPNNTKHIAIEDSLKYIIYMVIKMTHRNRLDPKEILKNISSFYSDPPHYSYYNPDELFDPLLHQPIALDHSTGLYITLSASNDFYTLFH